MEITRIKVLWFSATGTTEKVVLTAAEQLKRELKVPVEKVNFTTPEGRKEGQKFQKGDLVLAAVPVYAGRVPNVLLPYLTEKLQGRDALAIPVVVYGNRNFDDALIELRNILETNGLRTVAAGGFVAEHSFSTVLGAGRPDEKDLEIVREFARQAAEKIKGLAALPEEPVRVRGEDPVRPYYKPRDRQGNFVNILKVKPVTDPEKCDQCGLCAALCPMGSIDAEDAAKINGICIKCCACVKKCPKGAKYFTDAGYLYHQHELEEGYTRRAEPELFF